jgi:hypothetical protein
VGKPKRLTDAERELNAIAADRSVHPPKPAEPRTLSTREMKELRRQVDRERRRVSLKGGIG